MIFVFSFQEEKIFGMKGSQKLKQEKSSPNSRIEGYHRVPHYQHHQHHHVTYHVPQKSGKIIE